MNTMNNIKKSVMVAGVIAALSVLNQTPAQALEMDYASVPGGLIQFDGLGGGGFSFSSISGVPGLVNLQIGYSDSFTASSVGDYGLVSGNFALSGVSGNTATVTGSGTLVIYETASDYITGTVDWQTITVDQAFGHLNLQGAVNSLTSVSKTGIVGQQDLVDLAVAKNGIITLSFNTLGGAKNSLAYLMNHQYQSTFSGAIISSVPDGGMTMALLGFVMVGVEGVRRRFAK